MDEEAILDSYNLFKGEGYNGSIEDYKTLLSTNTEAVQDSYNLFKGEGYTNTQEDFEILLGVKKKATSESISTDQELVGTSIIKDKSTSLDTGGVPKRDGVRINPDGTESTHLMSAEVLEDGTWVGFPRLFQDEDGTWVDMTEGNWEEAYQEALKRGEVKEFGTDKEKAIAYGEGSWKSKDKSSNKYISDLLIKAESPDREDKLRETFNPNTGMALTADGKVDLIEDIEIKEKLNNDYNIQTALKVGIIDQEDIDLALKGDIDSIKKIQDISTSSPEEITATIKEKRLDVPYAYEVSSDLKAYIQDPKDEAITKEAIRAVSVFEEDTKKLIKESPDADEHQLSAIINRKGGPTQEQYDIVENLEELAPTGFEGSVTDLMYDTSELSKIEGFNTVDFDGHLIEQGYQEKYQRLLAGEVISEDGVDIYFSGTHNPTLAAERLRLDYLNKYVQNQLQRDYDFQVLDYKLKNKGHHPSLDGVQINPSTGIDDKALATYIEKAFPIVVSKLKNQDVKNQEVYQQHKNGDIRFVEDMMKQGWRSLEDRINNFSASTYDVFGMDDTAEGIRMGKAETAMGRTGLLRYTYASGKQAEVNGIQYLVDENNQIYNVDSKIAVSDVLNPTETEQILKTVSAIGKDNWSFSPAGGAVATSGIVTDMVVQIAVTRGVGVLGQGIKGFAVGATGLETGGSLINILSKIPIKATTASASIAQGTLFSSNLFEQARIQAIDAGLTVQEADELATIAGSQGFVLGFLTAPLSTQTYAMNKVFGSEPSKKLIKSAADAYARGGSKAAISVWKKAEQKVIKYAPVYLREGGKETFQENIQQVGQTYGIGSNVNEAAGTDVMKETITLDELANTTFLSLMAGMIMPFGGDLSSGVRKTFSGTSLRLDAVDKIKSLDLLSKNVEKTTELLNSQVNKGVYTEDQVEKILADVEVYRTSINSIPTNLSPETSLSVMSDISKINKLKNLKEAQDPSFHPAIDKKIFDLRNDIVKKSNFDYLSDKGKKELKDTAMNELLNESKSRGEKEIDLNDNMISDRAIENFSKLSIEEQRSLAGIATAQVDKKEENVSTKGEIIQEGLEQDIKDLEKKRSDLREEDGSISKENISEFKQLGVEIDAAKLKARRGNLGKGIRLSIRLRKDDSGKELEWGDAIATGEVDVREENKIESLIQQVLNGDKTADEVIQEISNVYGFNLDEFQSIKDYINDRTSDAPEIGNNKQSFPSWRKGEYDSTTEKETTEVTEESKEAKTEGFTTKREKQPQTIKIPGRSKIDVEIDADGKAVAVDRKTRKPVKKVPLKVQKFILEQVVDVNDGTRLDISEEFNPTPQQYTSEVADNSTNVKEIAETIDTEARRLKNQTKEEKRVAADPLDIKNIIGHITEEDFIKWGDRNNITTEIRKYWFRKKEKSITGKLFKDSNKKDGLDVAVMGLDGYTEDNSNEMINDVIDFILDHPTGKLDIQSGKSTELINLEVKFEELTGLKPTPTNIKTVLDIDPNREPISSLKDKSKNQYQKEASEPGVFSKNKKGPSAKSIVSKKPKKLNNVDEASALKDQIRLEIKAANDSKKDQTTRRKALGNAIKALKKAGKITTAKMNTLIGKVTGVNLNNSRAVAQVLSYVEKVNNDANAAKKNTDAKNQKKRIKTKLNKDTDAEVSNAVKRFLKIDIDLVSDLDAYSAEAEKIIAGLTKSKETKDGGIDIKDAVDIKAIDKYTTKTQKDQDIKLREAEAQSFRDMTGLSSDELTLEQMRDILNNNESKSKADENGENIPGVKANMVSEAAKKAFSTYKSIINSIIKTKVDPFTGEAVNLSIDQKILIKSFMDIDLDLLTTKEKLLAIDALVNFATNQGTGGMGRLVDRVKGIKGVKKAKRQGLKAVPLKLYFSKAIGTAWNDYIAQLPTTLESMFGGQSQALIFSDLSGFSKLRRGAAKAAKITNNIADAYHKKFIKGRAKPNGEVFNSLDNDIERGMFANTRRTVDGTKEEQANEFDRRKGLIEQTIDRLKEEGETKKYEAYKRVYDKILKESKNVSDVDTKVNRINKKAVEWFTNEWTKIRPELGSISLDYYNRVLEKEINYTPDSMTKVDPEASNDLKIGEPLFQGSRETIYDKETGVLMAKKPGYKLPSGRIVNLGFDSQNISSLKAALTDMYTAGPIQQLKGFTESPDFQDIVPNVSNRKLLLQRFNRYVDSKREVSQSNKNNAIGLKIINSVAAIGVSRVLGGPTQVPKQLVPIVNTAINLINDPASVGEGLTLALSNPDANEWLNNSGYEIANRGIQSITNLEGTNSKLRIAASSTLGKGTDIIIDLNKKYLELFLVAPDKYAARSAWLAYYLNNLKKQGLVVEDGDWSKHTINEKAADFAQQQTSRQQNTSDSDLQGRLFSSRNMTPQVIRKVFFPFANFLLNQKARMFSDLGILTSRSLNNNQDRVAAAKSLTGLVGETIVFGLMGLLTTQMLAGLSGYITDDDSRRVKKKDLDNRIKGRLGNMVNDVLSPIPLTDPLVTGAINNIIKTFSDEKDPWQFFNKDKKTLIERMGVLGITPKGGFELIEMVEMASTGSYTDAYGNKQRIKTKYKDAMAINAPLYFSYLVGLLPIEAGAIIRYNVRSYKRKSKR